MNGIKGDEAFKLLLDFLSKISERNVEEEVVFVCQAKKKKSSNKKMINQLDVTKDNELDSKKKEVFVI